MRSSQASAGEAVRLRNGAAEHAMAKPAPRKRARRPSVLPASLPPRGLSREQAAEWWGVSPTSFDRGVADGRIPKAYRFYGRNLWDRLKLERAFSALDTDATDDHPWGSMTL